MVPAADVPVAGAESYYAEHRPGYAPEAIDSLVDRYLDDVPPRRPGAVEYDDPWDAMLAERGFVDVETRYFDQELAWTVDDLVGYVYSLSFARRDAFGDAVADFERDVRERLGAFDGRPFVQETATEVITGRNPA